MIKILRVLPFYAPAYGYGGPVVHSENISKLQASMGYDVRIFTSNILTNDAVSTKLPNFEIKNKVKIHRFPIKYRLGQSHYFVTPSLPLAFFKYDYDIIHAHSLRTFQNNIATLMARVRNKPFVFTAHGTLRNMYLLNLFLTKKRAAERMRYSDYIFKNFFINTVDIAIVHSEHEKFWTLKFDFPEEKIRVIPHGVNIHNFTNFSHKDEFIRKFKPQGKVLLYVGRLLRNYRQLEMLIRIMVDIRKEFDAKLWLVGQSYDLKYEKELKRLVKQLNLSENVVFITMPSRNDILGAYQCADIFLFPITESDSFGIPLIESGAARCPVISTNRGPAPEIIENGITGILINKNSEEELKRAILKLLNDENYREKLGINAFNRVKAKYTWEAVTKETNKVYNELL